MSCQGRCCGCLGSSMRDRGNLRAGGLRTRSRPSPMPRPRHAHPPLAARRDPCPAPRAAQVNLWWRGQLLARMGDTKDDAGNAVRWPLILPDLRGDASACPCCDLCRAQPNNASQLTAIRCKQYSYRASDGACRLWANAQGNGNSLDLNDKATNWVSGAGALPARCCWARAAGPTPTPGVAAGV